MNAVNIIGRLTRDPELRYTPSGTAVCQLGVAVDRAGDKQDDGSFGPGFFDVTVWGTQGESSAQYLIKGQQVGISGRLTQHRWEAQDGTKRSKVEINADRVDFLAKPQGNGGGEGNLFTPREEYQPQQAQPERDEFEAAAPASGGTFASPDDDIPF